LSTRHAQPGPIILVTDDVEETRDGIEKLLTAGGYRVLAARNEADAVEKARRQRPDLILVSLSGRADAMIESGRRIRDGAGLGDEVPVVVFCVQTVSQGAELAVGHNLYATRPDNFDQLRAFIGRLLGSRLTIH